MGKANFQYTPFLQTLKIWKFRNASVLENVICCFVFPTQINLQIYVPPTSSENVEYNSIDKTSDSS